MTRVRPRRPSPRRPRLRWLALLLVVSGVLFCLVVVWHRDSRMHYVAMESTRQVQDWIEDEVNRSGHLPFSIPDSLIKRLGFPAIPYPERDALYRLHRCTKPYILYAGERQGLILPGGDGSPAILMDRGKLRTVWLSADQVIEAKAAREAILQAPG